MGLKREKNVRKTGKLWKICMEKTWEDHGKTMEIYIYMEENKNMWENYGK
jgi:hypothetical protein